MGTDEKGTHLALKGHRKELVDPLIAAHKGHIVKTTGDGQVDTVGRVLPLPLVAKVGDAAGNPMANIRVDFQITSGSGTLSARADTSGVDGLVPVIWTLGTAIGTQAVRFTDPNGAAGAVSSLTLGCDPTIRGCQYCVPAAPQW